MRLSRRSLLAAPALLAVPGLAQAREGAPGQGRAVVQDLMTRFPIPAASVAVWRQGGLVWSEAFGQADREAGLPAQPHDRFRLASVSKVVTAAATVRLAEHGVVDLDAPISRYRSGLPAQHRQTTLRQLLSHQGGVRHYIQRDIDPAAPGGPIDRRTYATTADKLAVFLNDPLVARPGEAVHYSTFGYSLVGAVLESAAGKPFPMILADEVVLPLALGSLEPEMPGVVLAERVCDYQPHRSATGEPDARRCDPINPAYKWPGGGLLGAAPDLARFCGAFTRPGYLSATTLGDLFTVRPPSSGAKTNTALGWRLDHDAGGRRVAHHSGSILGGRSVVMLLPEESLAVAILTNLGQVDFDPVEPAQRIAEAFLG